MYISEKLKLIDRVLFPDINIYPRHLSVSKQICFFVLGTFIFSLLGKFIPADGFMAFDWVIYFEGRNLTSVHPPWLAPILIPFSWPTLVGVTISTTGLGIIKRTTNLTGLIFALFTLPLFWVLFLGQIDGLVLLGITGLPWLTPFALLKPQLSIFAFLAKRSYLIGLILFLLLSVIIWGDWPLDMVNSLSNYSLVAQDISLKYWGVPIALVLLWFSRGDIDMLMAAGAFGTFYLIPYHTLLIVPSIARLPPLAAVIACILSWLPLSANWIGPKGWWFGWLFISWIWIILAYLRYKPELVGMAKRFMNKIDWA